MPIVDSQHAFSEVKGPVKHAANPIEVPVCYIVLLANVWEIL